MPSMQNPAAHIPAQAPSRPAAGEPQPAKANFMDSLVDDLSLSLKGKDASAEQPRPVSGTGASMKDLKGSQGMSGFNPF
jgi:hypothetical protein